MPRTVVCPRLAMRAHTNSGVHRALLFVAFATALPARAAAYEGRTTVSVLGGVSSASETVTPVAPTVGVSASLGLGDTFTLRGHSLYAIHPSSTPEHSVRLGAELLYMVDVATWVPFAGAGIDGLLGVSDEEAKVRAGAHAVIGLDRWLRRDLLVGADLRGYYFAYDVLHFHAVARITWAFERY